MSSPGAPSAPCRRDDRIAVIISMWSAKGGVGLSVTAAAVSVAKARQHGEALLVDLVGDQAAILGMAEPSGPGVFDWLCSEADSPESLERLGVPTSGGLGLLPPGRAGSWAEGRVVELVDVLNQLGCPVVIDCGIRRLVRCDAADEPSVGPVPCLVDALCSAGSSVLVSSSCYLALRRAVGLLTALEDTSRPLRRGPGERSGAVLGSTLRTPTARPEGLIVVTEPGRALDASDVAAVTQLELMAQLERDPAVARCVDAGQFLRRPPRSLLSALGDLW